MPTSSRRSPKTFFEEVAAAALGSLSGGLDHDIRLCGMPVRVSYSDARLEQSIHPAIAHLTAGQSPPDLHVVCWSSLDAGSLLLDGGPWEVRERWSRGQVVSVDSEWGLVAFDPRVPMVSLYDRANGFVSCWTPEAESVSFHARVVPFIAPFNWWLAERNVALCHAAAIGDTQSAVLIPGSSGSGKSTMAVAAAEEGLRFLGDDHVAVSVTDRPEVWSLYATAKLDAVWLSTEFPDLVDSATPTDTDKALVHIPEIAPGSLADRAAASAILIQRFSGSREPEIVRASAGEAFRALGPWTMMQLPGLGRERYRLIADLSRRIPAFELRLSIDRRRNVGLIRDFIAGVARV